MPANDGKVGDDISVTLADYGPANDGKVDDDISVTPADYGKVGDDNCYIY
jgi:hypothetical protein